MSVGIRFGGPDRPSIKLLEGWPGGLYFSPLVERQTNVFNNWLRDELFGDGAVLFYPDEHSEVIARFREITGIGPDVVSPVEIKRHVRYFLRRVRNYAHIETMVEGLISQARVVGDCHDGHRNVNVIDAHLRIGWMKTLTLEDYRIYAYGADFGFPPFDLECVCLMEGVIAGIDD